MRRIKHMAYISLCLLVLLSSPAMVMAETSKDIKEEIQGKRERLSGIRDKKGKVLERIGRVEEELGGLEAQLGEMEEEWGRLEKSREEQYQDMKLRIQYMYENGNGSSIALFVDSGSASSMLVKEEEGKSIAEYDREKLKEYEDTLYSLEAKQEEIVSQISKAEELQGELEKLRGELKGKIKAGKADIQDAERRLKKAKAREERMREEEERRREEANARPVSGGSAGSYSLQYSAPYNTGADRLTRSKGVVYYGGHKETYYSQRVLPGHGLSIPGRHVAEDGTIRDKDGFICVAAATNYMSRGAVVMTSLGPAKVYDCGCNYGTIDIYVDW